MRVNTHQTQPIFSTPNAEITPLATLRHGAQQVSVIRQKMESGHHNPMHTQTTEEVMVVLKGKVVVNIEDQTATVKQGDTVIIPPNTPHSIENRSKNTAEWIIISPARMKFKDAEGNSVVPPWAE